MDKLYKKLIDMKTKQCICGETISLFRSENQLPRFSNTKIEGALFYCTKCGLVYAISIELEDSK